MTAPVTIREVMTDKQLFGDQFGGDSFAAWRALLAAFYGLELTDDERRILEAITGRAGPFLGAFSELWMAIGRRGGKSQIAALVAVFEAAFKDHRDKLAPGEWATVMLLAADRQQARTLLRYTRGLFQNPMLAPLVTRETESSIELGGTRTIIEIATASHRATRGYTVSACVADEIAFWFHDGASPDRAIIQAIRPALATLGGPLLALSSPYARRGILWDTYKAHYAGDSDRILVAQAPSLTMNPTLPESVVAEAMRDDPASALAEYGAQFRTDIASFIDPVLVEDATRRKPLILPPREGITYRAFCDPSGGGADGFSLAVAHTEAGRIIIDLVTERHGSPAKITGEYASILRQYRITEVTGDRYSGAWVRDEFSKHGIRYHTAPTDRSGLYLEFLAKLNSGSVILPPDPKLQRQLIALERRTSRGGRDTIDHPPNAHDDLANSIAGAVAISRQRQAETITRRIAGLL